MAPAIGEGCATCEFTPTDTGGSRRTAQPGRSVTAKWRQPSVRVVRSADRQLTQPQLPAAGAGPLSNSILLFIDVMNHRLQAAIVFDGATITSTCPHFCNGDHFGRGSKNPCRPGFQLVPYTPWRNVRGYKHMNMVGPNIDRMQCPATKCDMVTADLIHLFPMNRIQEHRFGR